MQEVCTFSISVVYPNKYKKKQNKITALHAIHYTHPSADDDKDAQLSGINKKRKTYFNLITGTLITKKKNITQKTGNDRARSTRNK